MVLAHVSIQRSNAIMYAELVRENPWLYTLLQILRDDDAPYSVSTRRPLILLILYDQSKITFGWTDALVLDFYRKLRGTLADTGLQIACSKSSPPNLVAKQTMPFIGHVINLADKTIHPNPKKWANVATAKWGMSAARTFSFERRQTLIGRLSWFSEIRRGLLVTFDGV